MLLRSKKLTFEYLGKDKVIFQSLKSQFFNEKEDDFSGGRQYKYIGTDAFFSGCYLIVDVNQSRQQKGQSFASASLCYADTVQAF
ncbi:hypothetical protein BpHYR1_020820 [Brachionus plicatilis]|uniref:Uncharacterized protein n=1 Tax=Brachionus plicatilis TaxID=10195 RepID=A0A3M7PDI2_BRAPC|nr:hypothetical protein BpHYR1_020820 [Brachionus plicatilis]